MSAHAQLEAGRAAMASGDWASARDDFRSAWDETESADALDGLGRALWWLDDPGRALELRARAFALLRGDARTYTATHRGDFAGVPASGRAVKFAGWDLLRIRDGKIVEITQYCDLFMIMSQIGALPTAAPV